MSTPPKTPKPSKTGNREPGTANASQASPPDLATLAQWFGADRWALLEKQAAIARAWTGNAFRLNASEFLARRLKRAASPARAVYEAACDLLRACNSEPSEADRARAPK